MTTTDDTLDDALDELETDLDVSADDDLGDDPDDGDVADDVATTRIDLRAVEETATGDASDDATDGAAADTDAEDDEDDEAADAEAPATTQLALRLDLTGHHRYGPDTDDDDADEDPDGAWWGAQDGDDDEGDLDGGDDADGAHDGRSQGTALVVDDDDDDDDGDDAPPPPPPTAQLAVIGYRTPWHDLLHAGGAVGLVLAAVLTTARTVDPARLGDLGLGPALPTVYWLALGALSFAFAFVVVRGREPSWMYALHVGAAIALLPGLSVAVNGAGRSHVALRHVGIAENLMRVGWPDRSIDAYFNWPGFFSLSGFLARTMGFEDTRPFVMLAPVVWAVLGAATVHWMVRQITVDRRVTWLATWLYVVLNWVNQDYFAPQSLANFLMMVVVGILLADRRTLGVRVRVTLYGAAVLLSAAIMSMHQLTPFALVFVVTGLVVLGGVRFKRLPTVLLLLLATWSVYAAGPFFNGRLKDMLASVGLESAATANVGERLSGSAEHLFVVNLRLGFVMLVWLMAAGGLWQRRQHLGIPMRVVIGLGMPFLLLPLQPYGGEMLLRVYLFSLPFAALSVAFAFLPSASSGRAVRRTTGYLAPVLVLLAATGVVTRYGNDAADVFTPGELAAVETVYEQVGPGAILVGGDTNTPWKYEQYESHKYELLPREWQQEPTPVGLVRRLLYQFAAVESPSYVIVTASNVDATRLYGSMPMADLEAVERLLRDDPKFEVVLSTEEAFVVKYVGPLKGQPTVNQSSPDQPDQFAPDGSKPSGSTVSESKVEQP